MTVIARRVASIPARLASETWIRIVDLLAPTNTEARTELRRATGVASSLITRQAAEDSPIVVAGKGSRIRIYCVHGERAIEGDGVREGALSDSPVESGTWSMSLPCPPDDLSWVEASLSQISSRITARDMGARALADSDGKESGETATIDRESFLRS